ncbi:hypothetical protein K493DRAFT_302108 [Basidiobolus meristosporus CBS 931.73]|uniref:Uncharacterized protein n=1 Tax=Basidiobolus meristosporus CBS 931.73 TaxID=1314790 RepID=A0A1Y1Y8L5_9FUNG|nr:hypothetical protein K493DRAFT_302108 [Basidiobolus meristosporus CBS 931.73]|eukprot:ORX94333.1 hypothetical protein K493DRAFT_302108 [Basidiobolus meristosporus CBS 931.73]
MASKLSFLLTENHWKLIAQNTAPDHGRHGLGYVYQFRENWESNVDRERREILWLAASISPLNNANKVHPDYYAEAASQQNKNGIMLKRDGMLPGTTNTTVKQWLTKKIEPTVAMLETVINTIVQAKRVRGSSTNLTTFAPSVGIKTKLGTTTNTITREKTVTKLSTQHTITAS